MTNRDALLSRIGRKRAIQIPTVLLMIFIVAAGFCPNYYLYIVTQFMSGVGMGGYRVNSIVLGKIIYETHFFI